MYKIKEIKIDNNNKIKAIDFDYQNGWNAWNFIICKTSTSKGIITSWINLYKYLCKDLKTLQKQLDNINLVNYMKKYKKYNNIKIVKWNYEKII